MRLSYQIWTITLLTELFSKCYCLSCVDLAPYNNCSCIEFSNILLGCPSRQNTNVKLTMNEKSSQITITCHNQSSQSNLNDVPELNLRQFLKLGIENCGFRVNPKEAIQKLHATQISRLIITEDGQDVRHIDMDMYSLENLPSIESLDISFIYPMNLYFKADCLKNVPNLTSLKLERVSFTGALMQFNDVPNLTKLFLPATQIKHLPRGCFKTLTKLFHLDLSQNQIEILTQGIFEGVKSLQVLDLSFNRIKSVSNNTFLELRLLKDIDLSNNKISYLTGELFVENVALRKIRLHKNPLINIPVSLFWNTPNLNWISLNNLANVSSLAERLFENLKELKHLDLADIGKLTHEGISENIFSSLKKLTFLDLSYNNLGKVNMQLFKHFSNKTKVYLKSNGLTDFPDIPESLTLGTLDLSINSIRVVKLPEIVQSSVEKVNLSRNKINKIDFGISENVLRVAVGKNIKKIVTLKDNQISSNCQNFDLFRYKSGKLPNVTKVVVLPDVNQSIFKDPVECPVQQKGCPTFCNCSFVFTNNSEGELLVDCSSKNLTSFALERGILDLSTNSGSVLEELYGNHFRSFMPKEAPVKLNLSGNSLTNFDWIFSNIKSLDLSNNRLKSLDINFLKMLNDSGRLEELRLDGNPWDCGCISSDLRLFLNQNIQKVNSSKILCQGTDAPLISTSYCDFPLYLTIMLPLLLGILLCFAIACAFYYRYQAGIKMFLYSRNLCLSWITEEELDKNKTYDVFVSYSHKDEDFVLNHLLPGLENSERTYKVCIHVRDWSPGNLIMEQIVRSVNESRRTLVVLSNNFTESIWGKMEFRIAYTAAITERRTKLIVVLYGDLDMNILDDELKSYLRTNTYVQWGDKYFWDKLRYSLPHSTIPKRKVKPFKTSDRLHSLENGENYIKQPSLVLDPSLLTGNYWTADKDSKLPNFVE